MPTKTGAKIRIIVLGTGPDAEEAREIAAADADVAVAAKFTKTVTHLLIDDTVKSSEARVKKAEETGVPVIKLAELKELLVDGATETVAEPEEAPAAEAAAEPEPEPAAEAAPEPAAEPDPEPEPVAETEPEPKSEPEPVAEAEPEAEPEPEDRPAAVDEPAAEPEPEKVVPAQAEPPKAEREPVIDHIEDPAAEQADSDEEAPKPSSKPGFMAKLKSIFGKTGANR